MLLPGGNVGADFNEVAVEAVDIANFTLYKHPIHHVFPAQPVQFPGLIVHKALIQDFFRFFLGDYIIPQNFSHLLFFDSELFLERLRNVLPKTGVNQFDGLGVITVPFQLFNVFGQRIAQCFNLIVHCLSSNRRAIAAYYFVSAGIHFPWMKCR